MIHEPLHFDEENMPMYNEWLDSLEKKRLLNQILDAFLVFSRNGETLDEAIDITDAPMHRGFILHLDSLAYPFATYRYLLEYLKDQILKAPYFLSLKDVMTRNEAGGVRTVYRYYLKPSLRKWEGGLRPQLFGNVKLELHVLNDAPLGFHCLSSIYQDRAYEKPSNLKDLMETLLLQ